MRCTLPILSAFLGILVAGSAPAAHRHHVSGLMPGTYNVYLNDQLVQSGLSCGSSGAIAFQTSSGGSVRVVRSGSSSVEDTELAAELLTISPNPTQGQVSLVWSLNGPEETSLALYDASGRQIGPTLHRDGHAGRNVWPLDLDAMSDSRAAAGVYFIRLRGEDEVRTTRVVVLPGR